MIAIKKIKKKIKLKILAKLLHGNNVYCPICDKGFTTFIPHLKRINACCPNCGSLERTRILWYYINQRQLLNNKLNLLHVAPEHYLFKLFHKNPDINYFPIDKFTKGYSYPPETKEMDVTALSFKNDYFDAIICLHVLEHVVEDVVALKEFYRVLKPNAWAIIQVPFDINRPLTYEDKTILDPRDRLEHFGQTDHVRIYGTDYIDRFKSVGFKVEDWNFQESIPKEIIEKHVFKNEPIFLLRK